MERTKTMSSNVSKMSKEVRDKDGYPLEGVDEVPQKIVLRRLPNIIGQLSKANKRCQELEESSKYWERKYHDLLMEYMIIKFGDLCLECQKEDDKVKSRKYIFIFDFYVGCYKTQYLKTIFSFTFTEGGGELILCDKCKEGKQTRLSLEHSLQIEKDKVKYWQHCFETLLEERGRKGKKIK